MTSYCLKKPDIESELPPQLTFKYVQGLEGTDYGVYNPGLNTQGGSRNLLFKMQLMKEAAGRKQGSEEAEKANYKYRNNPKALFGMAVIGIIK